MHLATIVKTPAGTWKALVRKLGYPTAIKTFPTKRECEDWGRQVEVEMTKGVYIDRGDSTKISIATALDRYESQVTPTKKASTARAEINRIKHLKVELGKYSLASLTPQIVSAYRDRKIGEGQSNNTVRLALALLGHLYSTATKEWGLGLIRNPVSQVRKPSVAGSARTRRLTPAQLAALLEACRKHCNPMLGWAVELLLETAMRKGELMTLRMDQIDVQRQIVRLLDTKNGSERTVPISIRAAQLFVLALANPLRPADCDLVFFGDPGKAGLRAPYTIDKLFDACRKKANISDYRLHDFRHEATSRLVERGTLSDIDVASITGHKSMQMLRRYAHLRAENLVGLLK